MFRRQDLAQRERNVGQAHPPKSAGGLLEGQPLQPSRARCAGAALAYMSFAIMLLVFNKVAVSSYKFKYANIITLLQLIMSNVLLGVMVRFRVISLYSNTGDDDHNQMSRSRFVPIHVVKATLPLSVAYLLYMVMGMASIGGVNLPMYTTLRRTTAAFTMAAEYILGGKRHPYNIIMSVVLMVVGALVASAHDLTFDVKGYLLVLGSNVSTAVYLQTIARFGQRSMLNSFGLMWCNGLVCAPVLLMVTLVTGELAAALQYEHLNATGFKIALFCSCSMAFLLNYSIFINTSLNSALTQTVCGNLKDMVVILVGFVWFGDAKFHPINFAGILLGVAGSIAYAVFKLTGAKPESTVR
ncbi:hypothetical protein CYMTET_38110 [Cymbomonas tetramitiformis]|uniref:Sugar phosphate transporter domain-containing protein n=1 Tax=Cymbomonas tetramitiformis TaxID=36881 RepID=A0AAE0CDY7_9CHLO|nr:hypothetical protein CYMTET_38110 [Cymbomonas tetramitiformis]